MGYSISLNDRASGEVLCLDKKHFMRGSMYAIDGTTELRLSITYNYAKMLYNVFGEKGIRTLYGMSGSESIHLLNDAIAKLGDDVHDNYWVGSEGNVKQALVSLLAMAYLRPDGVWGGD